MALASTKSAYARHSKRPVTGNLGIVYRYEAYLADFTNNLVKTIEVALNAARRDLRAAVRRDPFWAPYEALLDVEFRDGEFHYIINGSRDQITAMLNLEFGTGAEPPRPLFRRLALTQGVSLGSLMSKRLSKDVEIISA